MDCGPIASGLAYNGIVDESPKFDRVTSVKLRVIWFTDKVKTFLSGWNISVHDWLKNYVFMRMLPTDRSKGRKGQTKAALTTFMVSAIWHGFYTGFFSFFFGCFLMDTHQKLGIPVVGPLVKGVLPD